MVRFVKIHILCISDFLHSAFTVDSVHVLPVFFSILSSMVELDVSKNT